MPKIRKPLDKALQYQGGAARNVYEATRSSYYLTPVETRAALIPAKVDSRRKNIRARPAI